MKTTVSRPMLERLPFYIECLERFISSGVYTVSSTMIAKRLGFGEVQVRKELAFVSGKGKPRIGYETEKLLEDIRNFIEGDSPVEAVIVGAGRLGRALLGYNFSNAGVHIGAAFDINEEKCLEDMLVIPVDKFSAYCEENCVKIGIITVPVSSAQSVCDMMVASGIRAVWNFAPTELSVPDGISVINEKLSISLSHLRQQII